MDSQDMATHHVDASRPALGFPLGTALLLIVIFCLSGIFSCCYHWDKLRALRLAFCRSDSDTDTNNDTIHSPPKSTPPHMVSKILLSHLSFPLYNEKGILLAHGFGYMCK